ncbi:MULTISPECIES: hypothetical protein [unclassified Rhizobium]|jgi:hypothetical protein|uniref:hypothetical protein n=1 Tax=unclassified Rhizobium TaxID=2613769 RepID=UPI000647D478|nr:MULTISPECIES: hypothetical protein [unclassified Rhizobium]MBN8949321.1 hypothetical protein [Rhizobium tropici]OJY75125.1 MAG: hypothetical protein BGP09_35575 [Rhizobium sp. 60-20]RKD70893.1 hypothetical protein BJ928_103416 [Rhizobium sp. WW_1]
MNLLHYLLLFFGGVFLMNAVPHLVSGVLGRSFQSPFAKPHGVGLSSSTVNVVWGFANLVVAYLLLVTPGSLHWDDGLDALAIGLGAFALALFAARHFGKFHGGNTSEKQ